MSRGTSLPSSRLTPELLAQLQQWQSEAQAEDKPLSQKALEWILQQQGVTSVLVGASSVEQLAQNLKCMRSEEHTSELQSRQYLVCRLLLEKKKKYLEYSLLLLQHSQT